MAKIGDRIGAISHSDGVTGTVFFFGYGVYEGDFIPDKDASGFMAWLCRDTERANPRLRLDNGDVVWGCECWWGPEEAVKKRLEGKNVEIVSIKDAREESRASASAKE